MPSRAGVVAFGRMLPGDLQAEAGGELDEERAGGPAGGRTPAWGIWSEGSSAMKSATKFSLGLRTQWTRRIRGMFRLAGFRFVNAEIEEGFLEDVEAGESGGEGVVMLLEARASNMNTSVLIWQLLFTRVWLPSTMVKAVFFAYCAFATVAVAVLQLFYFRPGGSGRAGPEILALTAVTLLGSAVFLLMGFRLTSSYDRWWEGRKIWGMIVNRTRDVARQALTWVAPGSWDLAEEIVRWTAAYAVVTKHHLRYENTTRGLKGVLSPDDLADLGRCNHQPLYCLQKISDLLALSRSRGIVSDYVAMSMDANVTQLDDQLGACERILRTSLPFVFVIHARALMMVWLLSLPFATVSLLRWVAMPTCIVLAYGMLVMEDTATDVEEPFGHSFNALPIDLIVRTIQNNLLEMLERKAGDAMTAPSFPSAGGPEADLFERAVHQDDVSKVRIRRQSSIMRRTDSSSDPEGPISAEALERAQVWKASADHQSAVAIEMQQLKRALSFKRRRTAALSLDRITPTPSFGAGLPPLGVMSVIQEDTVQPL